MRRVEKGARGRLSQRDWECDCPCNEVLGHRDDTPAYLALDCSKTESDLSRGRSRLGDRYRFGPGTPGKLELKLAVEAVDLSCGSRCRRH